MRKALTLSKGLMNIHYHHCTCITVYGQPTLLLLRGLALTEGKIAEPKSVNTLSFWIAWTLPFCSSMLSQTARLIFLRGLYYYCSLLPLPYRISLKIYFCPFHVLNYFVFFLFGFPQPKKIEDARGTYERLVEQFPNAGKYWKIYIEHEVYYVIPKIFTNFFRWMLYS